MTQQRAASYRALVVDDEPVVCQLTIRALNREGFSCRSVSNGQEAIDLLDQRELFDVIVTDLHMPHKHGHALAVNVLNRPERPLLIVLTGVAEPRLAKDLLARGVDDIVWKPVAYASFAAKVRMLVDRHHQRRQSTPAPSPAQPAVPGRSAPLATRVTISDIESRLPLVPSVLPVSQAAFDVFQMTTSQQYSGEEIAAAIARDASLTAEVLRVANGSFYNPSGERIVELESAVPRIGQQRIGELAMATNALSAMTRAVLPWMDLQLAWRRSVAAGVAVELLTTASGNRQHEQGLLLGAIMQGLGRLVLATLYREQYERMVEACRIANSSLVDQEREAFPETHGQVLGRLLALWKIPEELRAPLTHTVDVFPRLAALPSALRTKVELIKLAGLVGELAVGEWEDWNSIELPSPDLLQRFNLTTLNPIIQQTRRDLERIVRYGGPHERHRGLLKQSSQPSHRVHYLDLAPAGGELVVRLLESLAVQTQTCSGLDDVFDEPVVVNCLGRDVEQLKPLLDAYRGSRMVLVCATNRRQPLAAWGRTLALPSSYAALRAAVHSIADPQLDAVSP